MFSASGFNLEQNQLNRITENSGKEGGRVVEYACNG